MTRLVFVTQKLDPSDPVLGFVVRWVQALAERCDHLVVIANEVGRIPERLNAEVISLGKEKGFGRMRRGLRYQMTLARVFSQTKPHGLLAHMCPVYLTLAAPLARLLKVRTMLWYAHPAYNLSLGLADRFADEVLTSFPGAYPRPNDKVRCVGQGIDTEMFTFSPPPSSRDGIRLLAVGRTSPSKGFATAIKAVKILRSRKVDVQLLIVGPSTTPIEAGHREELEALVAALGVGETVRLEQGLPYHETPPLYRESDALVNTMVSGSGDKVVLEAMASGRLVVVSNPVFGPLLEGLPVSLQFREGDEYDLADCISGLSNIDAKTREALGRELRSRVERNHSLDHWAGAVVGVASGPKENATD
jgi:glycosyltransferase involved in cell wall biosynthesis